MSLLPDTHLLVWLAVGNPDRSPTAVALLGDPDHDVMSSVAPLWDVSIKFALRRPEFTVDPRVLRRALLDNGHIEIDVTAQHALTTTSLPPIHRDPFDRLLIAQAVVVGVMLLTVDTTILRYPGPIRRV